MRPLIGVLPLWDTTNNRSWIHSEYMNQIETAGGIPIVLPFTSDKNIIKQLAAQLDGFLFTGGPDVNPALYNEEMLPECTELCPQRDILETLLFKEVFELNKPILGICRGLQMMNVMLGGTLYQDIPTQYNFSSNHRMELPYDRAVHQINILPDTPFSALIPCTELGVNTRHHQAIKDLAPCLKAGAISEDGLIEAIYHPDKHFVMAVQWHPESAIKTQMYSDNIFKAFIKACEK